MDREHMIRMLVEFSVAASAEDRQASWLREIFTQGFRGFSSMSSDELLREMRYRGLAGFDDSVEEENFEDDGATRIESLIWLHRSRSAEDAERG